MYIHIVELYKSKAKELSEIEVDDLVFPYLEKSLKLLKPWSICLDLGSQNRIYTIDEDQTNELLEVLSKVERYMSGSNMHRKQFDLGAMNCQRAISYAKRKTGDEAQKIELLNNALTNFCQLRMMQDDYKNAKPFAEEAYVCVADFHGPVHPLVQKAGGVLIECLIHNGDHYDAVRLAEMNLSELKNPANGMNQESDDVALGHYDLANVIWLSKGDVAKAEIIARETVRLYANNPVHLALGFSLLGNILMAQGKLDNETKKIL
eukprot:CAMPEP_0119044552 /NCGR_PEP_ID=MMETSP1177-20130426/32268_1 /TAXON_ID=2985 /ORGANISM="Ochromonas sp, Strain CCMP1899" /LENGTH=262 /DNA_ID=CAMNT_0007014789 /DNA_START=388 /DNA_END=1176 /DNA_ORIENTATION=-